MSNLFNTLAQIQVEFMRVDITPPVLLFKNYSEGASFLNAYWYEQGQQEDKDVLMPEIKKVNADGMWCMEAQVGGITIRWPASQWQTNYLNFSEGVKS